MHGGAREQAPEQLSQCTLESASACKNGWLTGKESKEVFRDLLECMSFSAAYKPGQPGIILGFSLN
jgi:hypothetical protein